MNALNRYLSPIRAKITSIASRATLHRVNDTLDIQLVQVSVHADEVYDNVEHPQEYGLASNCPVDGSGIVTLCPGGNREQILSIMATNPSMRVKNLEPGETALFNGVAETSLKLSNDGEMIATTAHLKSTGDVSDSFGTLDEVRQKLNELIKAYSKHTHTSAIPTNPTSSPLDIPPIQPLT